MTLEELMDLWPTLKTLRAEYLHRAIFSQDALRDEVERLLARLECLETQPHYTIEDVKRMRNILGKLPKGA